MKMKTYQSKKNEYLDSLKNVEGENVHRARIEGFLVSEKFVEEEIRGNIGPLSRFLQTISKIIDTKKESTREELLGSLIREKETIKELKFTIEKLINVTRL